MKIEKAKALVASLTVEQKEALYAFLKKMKEEEFS